MGFQELCGKLSASGAELDCFWVFLLKLLWSSMKFVEEELPCPVEALIQYKNWAHGSLWIKTKLTNRSHKQFTPYWHETVQKIDCSYIMLSLIKKSKWIQSRWCLQCNTPVLITRQFEYMRGNLNWLTQSEWMDNWAWLNHYRSLTS